MEEISTPLSASEGKIIDVLKDKACLKQKIYRQGRDLFEDLKTILKDLIDRLEDHMDHIDDSVELYFKETNDLECEIKFGGDILVFSMHTNVFKFDETHQIANSAFVQENPHNGYVNMIQIHNFLADSIKYNRLNDIGYLIGRIFINKDSHFYVEGQRQLGFLYNDFDNMIINEVYLRAIAEAAILYAIDFELYVPPYDKVKFITVQQRLAEHFQSQQTTAKRLGFTFEAGRQMAEAKAQNHTKS